MVVKASIFSATWGRAVRLFKRVRTELKRRPDSEHEMTINRFVLSGIVLAYLSIASLLGSTDAALMLHETAIYFAVYDLLSLLLFIHILYRPGVSVARRLLAIVLDLGLFSYGVAAGGESTAALYPIYLWVILGNGFRFGVKYLFAASFVAVVGFGTVIAVSEFWRTHLAMSAGLLAGLVVLPLYVSRSDREAVGSAAPGRSGEPRKKPVHRKRQSRIADAAERHHRARELVGKNRAQCRPGQHGAHDHVIRAIPAGPHQFDPRLLSRGIRRWTGDASRNLMFTRRWTTSGGCSAVQLGEKDLRLNLHITPRTPRYIKGDLHAFEGTLINLVGNAVKFTSQGYVTIAADVIDRQGGKFVLRIEVSDTGIGISAEAQTRIFESFTQADATIVDRFGGTGLGLATSKQLIERAGGAIGVESKPGIGSTFWFELDFSIAENPQVPANVVDPDYILLSRDPAVQRQLATARNIAVANTTQDVVSVLASRPSRRGGPARRVSPRRRVDVRRQCREHRVSLPATRCGGQARGHSDRHHGSGRFARSDCAKPMRDPLKPPA